MRLDSAKIEVSKISQFDINKMTSMGRKIISIAKSLAKPLFIFVLVLVLALQQADGALAARSGGRIGGGSFRAPSRSFNAPSRTYQRSPGGGYGYGGGFGFPFLIPFFGFGGGFGGLFTLFIVIAIANFLVRSFRNAGGGDNTVISDNPKVSVAKVQVGLLAEARELQAELDNLARSADTGSASGRARVLQEATLSLLRHPEYFAYGGTDSQQTRLNAAEAQFNQWSIAERSKFSEETLSNYNAQLGGDSPKAELPGDSNGDLAERPPGEYVVVTILAGVEGNLDLPKVNGTEELTQALRTIGGVSSDRLLAIEVLWTPQASGDTLSSDDLVVAYPNLTLV